MGSVLTVFLLPGLSLPQQAQIHEDNLKIWVEISLPGFNRGENCGESNATRQEIRCGHVISQTLLVPLKQPGPILLH